MTKSIEERLLAHPELREKFEDMLDIVENMEGNIIKADDAEERVLETMGEIGHLALTDWAKIRERMIELQMKEKKGVESTGKKKPLNFIHE